jgi:hypothetical protein
MKTTTFNTQAAMWGYINGLHVAQAIKGAHSGKEAIDKATEEIKDIFKAHGFKTKPEQKKKKGPKK